MFLEILAFFLGIFSGTLTGLIPGIHINLIATILISIPLASTLSPLAAIIFIVAMAITHTFTDFIPSIYLGAPDLDTSLATLPGHKMLLQGYGHHAIKLTLIGSTIATSLFILIIPIFILIIPKIENQITTMIPFFLVWILILLIHLEKKNKTGAILIITLAGFLGISTMSLNIQQPLLPLLTGLFGSSILITSIKSKTKVPKQNLEKIQINKKDIIHPAISTTIISPICSFLPGIGSNQAAIISSSIWKEKSQEQFLILLGSINTLVMATSFLTLYLTNKTRTGAAAAIAQLTKINTNTFIIITIIIILSSIISIFITLTISKIISKKINKLNYTLISSITLAIITIIVIKISGPLGLLLFLVSTTLGLLTSELEISKSYLMASLIIPTIIFYL